MEEFLAKMGLSLAQCKQKYQFMNSSVSVCVRVHSAYTAAASSSLTLLRLRLKDQIAKYGQEYGLDDVMYGSFQRFLGFKTPYSAADVVYYCTALIEHRPSDAVMAAGRAIAQQQQQQQSLAGAAAAATAAPQGGAQLAAAEAQAARDEKDAWLDSFNAAYDALGGRSTKEIQRGLEISMALQTALCATLLVWWLGTLSFMTCLTILSAVSSTAPTKSSLRWHSW
eukprot:10946-Heterococcus_DN1.PRE.2